MPRTNLSDLVDRQSGLKGARAIVSEMLWEMKDAGMSQSDLAKAIDMSPQVFSNRVKQSDFRVFELQRIANVLHKDIVIEG